MSVADGMSWKFMEGHERSRNVMEFLFCVKFTLGNKYEIQL